MQNTEPQPTDDRFQLKLSLFYAMLFLSIGCYLPYFPVWLKSKSLEPDEIGIILAAPMIIRIIFTPLISLWADYEGNYRKILIILSLGSLVALLAMGSIDGFWGLLIIASMNAIFGSSIVPLTETMAMIAVRANQLKYGKARSWGSFSFIIGSLGTGVLVDHYAASIVIEMLVLAGLGIFVAALLLPPPVGKGRLRQAISPSRVSKAGVIALLKHPLFWIFLVGAGLGQGCHAFYYGFSSVHWRHIGYPGWLVGSLWTIGVVSEIILFLVLGDWLRKFNPALLLLAGSGVAILRWLLMGFDPTLWLLVFGQVLHAFSFGIAHLGAVYFISSAVPEKLAGTAQGLYATMSAGVFMGALVLLSGKLYEHLDSGGYFVMAAVALVSFGTTMMLYLRWDRAELTNGE